MGREENRGRVSAWRESGENGATVSGAGKGERERRENGVGVCPCVVCGCCGLLWCTLLPLTGNLGGLTVSLRVRVEFVPSILVLVDKENLLRVRQ